MDLVSKTLRSTLEAYIREKAQIREERVAVLTLALERQDTASIADECEVPRSTARGWVADWWQWLQEYEQSGVPDAREREILRSYCALTHPAGGGGSGCECRLRGTVCTACAALRA